MLALVQWVLATMIYADNISLLLKSKVIKWSYFVGTILKITVFDV